jgi:hypothetical protein
MSKFIIEIETDNAAFGDDEGDWGIEAARLLREAAVRVERGYSSFPLIDYNGNKVGSGYFQKAGSANFQNDE